MTPNLAKKKLITKTMKAELHHALKKNEKEAEEIVKRNRRMAKEIAKVRDTKPQIAVRKIKEENPEVMTILLTGHADFEFGGSQALQSGLLFKILNKPCPPQKLAATITAAIEEKNGLNQGEEKAPDTVL